jgi:hypothetical protein
MKSDVARPGAGCGLGKAGSLETSVPLAALNLKIITLSNPRSQP